MENAGRLVKLCDCHSEPMLWHKMKDRPAGGLWRCAVRKREVDRAWQMRHYDADPIFRITKRLRDDARQRRRRIQRTRRELRGEVSAEG